MATPFPPWLTPANEQIRQILQEVNPPNVFLQAPGFDSQWRTGGCSRDRCPEGRNGGLRDRPMVRPQQESWSKHVPHMDFGTNSQQTGVGQRQVHMLIRQLDLYICPGQTDVHRALNLLVAPLRIAMGPSLSVLRRWPVGRVLT